MTLCLVLGTMAVENGGSDLSNFFTMFNLPQASSLDSRPLNWIECILGENLRLIAEDSMMEALEQEVHNLLKFVQNRHSDTENK